MQEWRQSRNLKKEVLFWRASGFTGQAYVRPTRFARNHQIVYVSVHKGQSMFEKQIIRNLRNPQGLFGMIVGRQLRENVSEYRNAIELLDVSNGMRLLDIGCGPGYGINEILKHNNALKIDGIDSSRLMCKSAQNNTDSSHVNILLGEFGNYEFDDEYYDRGIMLNVVYFWKDIEPYFDKLYRIIKSKGKIVLGMASPELLGSLLKKWSGVFNLHTIYHVMCELSNAGFGCILHEDKKIKGSYYIVGNKG